MSEMFDSATGQIPAGAQFILLPTDGKWAANNASVKAKFPNATYQTYTALGQVPAEWIDTEWGCVWPVSAAVSLWDRWKGNGITRGFYCSTSVKPQIQQLLMLPGDNPEWFEADPTQNPHVRAGDAQTQWGWFGSYDETLIADVPVKPSPPPKPGEEMDLITLTGHPTYLCIGTAAAQVVQPQDVNSLLAEGAILRRLDALTPDLQTKIMAKLAAQAA